MYGYTWSFSFTLTLGKVVVETLFGLVFKRMKNIPFLLTNVAMI